MKKFVVYLLVIVLAVSLGFAVFYLVKDDEVISISSASIYTDVNKEFAIDVKHENKKSHTKIEISTSDEGVVKYNKDKNSFSAISGGVARINFRTNNVKFRNLWCDVIVGDGTEASPYYISSVEQLSAIGMGEDLGNDVFAGAAPYTDYASNKCYKLVSDIDVKDINEGHWVPLKNFSGTFDGNGFTISNVNIDYDAYTEAVKNNKDYNPNLHSTENVGLFQTIDNAGKVFNIKFTNYRASGKYTNFGTVAGINYGTIERIEVKDTYLSVETDYFGGIVGKNITEDNGSGTAYERYIARIDRCSVNLTLGKKRVFVNGDFEESVIGNTNVIGGLVGRNEGGTIVYSYTTGEVNFLSDSLEKIVYGGLIGENTYKTLPNYGGAYPTVYQGANVKDCYSNIVMLEQEALTNAGSRIAGAIAINTDFSHQDVNNDPSKNVVQNYIIGVYYNADYLNKEQEGIVKQFNGIAEFTCNSNAIVYTEDADRPIVIGYKEADMKDANKYVSHYTQDLEFDDKGNSLGIQEIPVYWLFDTVWAIDADSFPYLNYQLVYVPNDFNTVGTPVLISGVYQYITPDLEYPITIVSGHNNIVNIEVGEKYNLKVNPVGLSLNWVSNDTNVVTVDTNGTITGIASGSASVTVSTKTGLFSAYVDVRVSDVSYAINNVSNKYSLTVGDSIVLGNTATVTPNTTTITYRSENTSVATVDATTGKVTAIAQGTTRIELKAGNTVKYTTIEVKAPTVTVKPVVIELNQYKFNYTYAGTPITGQLIVDRAISNGVDIKNQVTFKFTSTEPNILSVDSNGKFTVNGVGTPAIVVTVDGANYLGEAYCYFDIQPAQSTPSQPVPTPVYAGILKSSYYINVNDTLKVETYGSIQSIVWASSDTTHVTIDQNGVITGIAQGTSTITATILKTDGNYTYDSCDITVVGAAVTPVISITPTRVNAYVGDTIRLEASLNVNGVILWNIIESTVNMFNKVPISNRIYELEVLKAGTATVSVSYSQNGNNYSKTATITAVERATYTKEIYTIDQLKNVTNFLDREFVLCADLDLSSAGTWTPIGTESKPFTGKFEARRKNSSEYFSISGLNVNTAVGGLFGHTTNASISNVEVLNSNITGTTAAGSIVGVAKNTKIYGCCAEGNTINSTVAGGIVGKMTNGSTLYSSKVVNCTITTSGTTSSANIGGAVGNLAANCSINNVEILNQNNYISVSSGSHGYVGGIAGFSAGKISDSKVKAKITAGNNDNDYAGGVVGYTTGTIANIIISDTSIEGHYAGGIGGAINIAKTISISFKVTNKGYRKEDIQSIDAYTADVQIVAVKETVNIKGHEAGGLFGIVTSGVIQNCYTRAYLTGYSKTSYVSGFASQIKSTGFNKDGGRGNVGIIENCYSACTFSGSCFDFAISQSIFHDNIKNRTYGYVFNFVFDEDLADGTDFVTGLFSKDPAEAKKSTSEMHDKNTYTAKNFSASVWLFGNGYPTLVIEK